MSKPTPISDRIDHARAGFSLIEILISILILALGLLGLGALFPVVIREQRAGTDAINGVIVSNAVRASMSSAKWGNALPRAGGQPHPALDIANYGIADATSFLWDRMRYPFGHPLAAGSVNFNGSITDGLGAGFTPANQRIDQQDFGFGQWLAGEIVDLNSGELLFGYPDDVDVRERAVAPSAANPSPPPPTNTRCTGYVEVPVAARLFPSGPGVVPIYVWDVAFQRVPGTRERDASGRLIGRPFDDAVRAAIFVRRIDPRIRPPEGTSYVEAIRGFSRVDGRELADSERRLPVGENNLGIPTLDGTDGSGGLRYSSIQTVNVRFDFDDSNPGRAAVYGFRDRVYFAAGVDQPLTQQELRREYAFLRQPGQKIVDNLGNVYSVVGSGSQPGAAGFDVDGDGDPDYLKIDPPVPADISFERSSLNAGSRPDDVAIRQIAYTRQPPVSITLVDLLRGGRP